MATEPHRRITAYVQVVEDLCRAGHGAAHRGVTFRRKFDTFHILAQPAFVAPKGTHDQSMWFFNTVFTKTKHNHLFMCGATVDCANDVLDVGPVELFRTGEHLLKHCALLLRDFILTGQGHQPLLEIDPDYVVFSAYKPAEDLHVHVNRKTEAGWSSHAIQVTSAEAARLSLDSLYKLVDDKLHTHVRGKLRETPYVM